MCDVNEGGKFVVHRLCGSRNDNILSVDGPAGLIQCTPEEGTRLSSFVMTGQAECASNVAHDQMLSFLVQRVMACQATDLALYQNHF